MGQKITRNDTGSHNIFFFSGGKQPNFIPQVKNESDQPKQKQ